MFASESTPNLVPDASSSNQGLQVLVHGALACTSDSRGLLFTTGNRADWQLPTHTAASLAAIHEAEPCQDNNARQEARAVHGRRVVTTQGVVKDRLNHVQHAPDRAKAFLIR